MKKRQIILIHVIYWFYIMFQSYFLSMQTSGNNSVAAWDFIYFTIVTFILFYVFYGTVPFLFRYKRKIISVAAGISLLLALALVKEIIFLYSIKLGIIKFDIKDQEKIAEIGISFESYLYQLRSAVVNGMYAILIYILIEWMKSQKQKADLIMQNHHSELAMLRLQVSPHFLFNTLNNIDSLIYKDQNKASESVIKLSEIMRYMIYETSDEYVHLVREIDYLKNFIALHKLRLKDPDFVQLNIQGNAEGKFVAPLLFIPFVENAFKHGTKNRCSPGIIINIEIKETEIHFRSLNYFDTESLVKDKTSGIGLANVEKRLALIYPEKYKLNVKKENGEFVVDLSIKINTLQQQLKLETHEN